MVATEQGAPPAADEARRLARLVRLGTRSSYPLVSQGFCSLSNLVLSASVARAASGAAFGVFALTYLGLQLSQQLSRAALFEPLLLVVPDGRRGRRPRAEVTLVSTAFLVGSAASAVAALVLVATVGLTTMLAILLVVFPLALAQDSLRYASLSQDGGRAAMISDGVWVAAQVVAVVVFSLRHIGDVGGTSAWAIGVIAGLLVMLRRFSGVADALRVGADHVRTHRRAGTYFFIETMVEGASGFLATLSVGAFAGAAAAGRLQGAVILFGPINLLFIGLPGLLLPAMVRRHRSGRSVARPLAAAALAIAPVPLLLWLAIIGPLGGIVTHLLGSTGEHVGALIFPVALQNAIGGFRLSGRLYLRVEDLLRKAMWLRIANGGLTVLFGIGGAVLGGAIGAAWGLVVGGVVSIIPILVIVHRQEQARSVSPAPA